MTTPSANEKASLGYAVDVFDRWLMYQTYIHRIPGLSAGVVSGGRIIFTKGYGYADLAARKRATDKTCYRIASISKTFTAIAIMQLVEKGDLRLDDSLSTYLPWFSPSKKQEKITIRHLLNHSAGLTRDGGTAHWINDAFPTAQHIQQQARQLVNVFQPSEQFKYSNFSYALLGRVIEVATGISYRQYVTERIIRLLGLGLTSVDVSPRTKKYLAHGYGRDFPNQKRLLFPSTTDTRAMDSAAGVVSNAIDLCTYMMAQLPGDTRLLAAMSKREMQRIQWVRPGKELHYGLGYEIIQKRDATLFGHSGGFSGFNTCMLMDAKRKNGVTILTNALIGTTVYDLTLGLLHILAVTRSWKPLVNRSLKKYEGHFSERWSDTDIVAVEDHLKAFAPFSPKPLKEPFTLQPVGRHQFKIVSGSDSDYLGETVRFEFDRSGKVKQLFWGPNPMRPLRIL